MRRLAAGIVLLHLAAALGAEDPGPFWVRTFDGPVASEHPNPAAARDDSGTMTDAIIRVDIVDMLSARAGRYAHPSSMEELEDGTLIFGVNNGFAEARPSNVVAVMHRYPDGRWNEDVIEVEPLKDMKVDVGVLYQPQKDTPGAAPLLYYYMADGGPGAWSHAVRTSWDGGFTWSDRRFTSDPSSADSFWNGHTGSSGNHPGRPTIGHPMMNHPLEFADGSLLAASSAENPHYTRFGWDTAVVRIPADNYDGQGTGTWTDDHDFANPGIHPGFLVLSKDANGPKDIIMIVRGRDDHHFYVSDDGGATWNKDTGYVQMPGNAVGFRGVGSLSLDVDGGPAQGWHLCAGAEKAQGGRALHVGLSNDPLNNQWTRILTLTAEIGSATGEDSDPHMLQSRFDRAVHLAFTGREQALIKHYVLHPDILAGVPARPIFRHEPVTRSVHAGGELVLSASAKGDAPITYTWTRDGVEVGTGATLTIPDVGSQHAGAYVCTASNAVGTQESWPATVTVLGASAPFDLPGDLQEGVVGRAYGGFQLTAAGTGPITWSVAGGDLPPGLSLAGDGTITGTPTASGDFAVAIQAANSVGTAQRSYTLRVRDLPAADLAAWFMADRGVDAEAGRVGTMADQSGNARHARIGQRSLRPEHVAGGLNNRPVVRFNEHQDLSANEMPQALSFTYPTNGKTGLTIFMVAAPREDTPVDASSVNTFGRGAAISWPEDLNNGGSWFAPSLTHVAGVWGGVGRMPIAARRNSTLAAGAFTISTMQLSGGKNSIWVDGSLLVSEDNGVATIERTSDIGRLGMGMDEEYQFFKGDIAEVVIYGRDLSSAERQQVEAYLQEKWFGTPPSGNDPPAVAITAPADGAGFAAPADVAIAADASDSDGSVVEVAFVADGTPLGADADGSDGWTFDWTGVAAGTYHLTAVATDDDGAATTSTAVTITVTGASSQRTVAVGVQRGGQPVAVLVQADPGALTGTVGSDEVHTFAGLDPATTWTFSVMEAVVASLGRETR